MKIQPKLFFAPDSVSLILIIESDSPPSISPQGIFSDGILCGIDGPDDVLSPESVTTLTRARQTSFSAPCYANEYVPLSDSIMA
jgi:hypothetical protein